MKTSSAEGCGLHCPKCKDETTADPSGKGFVRHKSIRDCDYERGERDAPRTLSADG